MLFVQTHIRVGIYVDKRRILESFSLFLVYGSQILIEISAFFTRFYLGLFCLLLFFILFFFVVLLVDFFHFERKITLERNFSLFFCLIVAVFFAFCLFDGYGLDFKSFFGLNFFVTFL